MQLKDLPDGAQFISGERLDNALLSRFLYVKIPPAGNYNAIRIRSGKLERFEENLEVIHVE